MRLVNHLSQERSASSDDLTSMVQEAHKGLQFLASAHLTADGNGTSFLPTPAHFPQCLVASDASGHRGCGACQEIDGSKCNGTAAQLTPHYSEGAPSHPDHRNHMGPQLARGGLPVRQSGSGPVVPCLCSQSSRHKSIMHLLRNLVFIEAMFGFHIHPLYIDTYVNHLADDLSCDHALSFLSKYPRCPPTQPSDLVTLLLDPQADWISRHWWDQFRAILARV